jgi:8-amino-7-oxononanoate synthase
MLDFLADELRELEAAGLLRRESATPEGLLDVSSNDYLGYSSQPVSRATLLACEARPGAGASRLIHGTAPAHLALESEVADWVGLDSALLFSSGYSANLGLIPALVGPQDLVVSDALNHASIIDGCRLSRASVVVVPHRDASAVERALAASRHRRKLVVSESYFSMDGTTADLGSLRQICDDNRAGLIVDEAHALGVLGPEGGGLCRAAGVTADALVGTLGKAIGVQGAFVAGPQLLRDLLWNRARSLVFSTAPSPLICDLARENVRRARRDAAGREALAAHASQLRRLLAEGRVPVVDGSEGPIVPVVVGTSARALELEAALGRAGFRARAIRPPTVPTGAARIRITLSAGMDAATLERLARCLIDALVE